MVILEDYTLKHRIFLVKQFYQELGNFTYVKNNYENYYGSNKSCPVFSEAVVAEIIRLFEETGSIRKDHFRNAKNSSLLEIRKDKNPGKLNLNNFSRSEHQCEMCRKSFLYLSNLKRHVLDSHELEDAYKCDECSINLRKKHTFLMHMKNHQNIRDSKAKVNNYQKFLQCDECGKMCSNSTYYEHIATHNKKPQYKCEICARVFTWECSFKLHRMRHEGRVEKRNWPTCGICGQEMAGQRTLKLHIERYHSTATKSKKFNVIIEHSPDPDDLEIKIEEKEDDIVEMEENVEYLDFNDDPLIDEICKESIVVLPLDFPTEDNKTLDASVDSPAFENAPVDFIEDDSESSDDFPGGDEFFNNAMVSVTEPEDSIRMIDTLELPGLCDICGKIMHNRKGLTSHMKTHSDDQPFKCPVPGCNRAYRWSGSYQWHKMTAHGDNRGRHYKCDICAKTYVYNYLLKNHLLENHCDEVFYCKICDRVFTQEKEYEYHQREWHESEDSALLNIIEKNRDKPKRGQKPLSVCLVCGKTFKYKQNMKSHMKSHAKSDEALMCPHEGCGRSFPIDKYLKLHLLRHTGQRYKCAHCEKDYKDRCQMKRHIRQYHLKEEPRYKCHICNYKVWHSGSFRRHMKRHNIDNPFPNKRQKL